MESPHYFSNGNILELRVIKARLFESLTETYPVDTETKDVRT